MQLPTYDVNGVVEPHDHEEIDSDWLLVRRICPANHVVFDENRNCDRISTKAYKPSSGDKSGMSIDLKCLIERANLSVADYVTTPVFTGSVEFEVSTVRSKSMIVGFDPLPENPYHGEVWGSQKPNHFTRSQVRAIQSSARWLVRLPDVELA